MCSYSNGIFNDSKNKNKNYVGILIFFILIQAIDWKEYTFIMDASICIGEIYTVNVGEISYENLYYNHEIEIMKVMESI